MSYSERQLILKIANDFRSKISFPKSNEVELFRKLALSITSHSKSIFIDETHGGGVCNVTFTSSIGKAEKCEIADLLIVSRSLAGALRATFWQAKKQGASKWVKASIGNEQFDFDGQFNQWDLLSHRPEVLGVGKFNPPKDILASFSSASIGTFGVFYQRGSLVEVSHSVAEFVACHNPTVKHPKMSINGYLEKYLYSAEEIIVKSTLEGFLDALFKHQVGALLNPAVPPHRWIARYVLSKLSQSNINQSDLTSLRRFLDDNNGDGPGDGEIKEPSGGDGLSILWVEANGDQQ